MKRYQNIVFPVCLLLFDLLYFTQTLTIEVKDFSTVAGARLVPYICSVILAVCAVILLVRAVREQKKNDAREEEEADAQPRSNYKNVVITLALIVVYAVFFAILGFILSTILFVTAQVFVLMPVKSKKNFIHAMIAGVVVSVLVYLLFTNIFFVMLPTGTLW